jgi:hypothetical protein
MAALARDDILHALAATGFPCSRIVAQLSMLCLMCAVTVHDPAQRGATHSLDGKRVSQGLRVAIATDKVGRLSYDVR